MKLLYLVFFTGLGLASDWALYSRLTDILCRPAFYGVSNSYRRLLFPRIIVTLVGIGAMFVAVNYLGGNVPILLGGSVLAFGSNLYAVYRFSKAVTSTPE